MPRKYSGQAVVIGGSLAGLFAARVLSERFDSVVILERDDLEHAGDGRRGVPQGRHVHALLDAGRNCIAEWFPGFEQELRDAGAPCGDQGRSLYWHQGGGLRAAFGPGDAESPVCSRPFLEESVRARVEKLDNLELITRVHVASLLATPDNARVTGITLDDGTTIDAALTLDCTGRAGASVKWIQALGYAPPPVEEVGIDMRYTSRIFERNAEPPVPGYEVGIEMGAPPEARLGAAFPLEGGRWMVTLCGYHGDHAPSDEEGFLEYAKTLPGEFVAGVVAACKPLSDFRTHRLPSNQRRQVWKMKAAPAGWALVGDSVASFNPIYGQGMSSAALQAKSLGETLDDHAQVDAALTTKIHKGAAKATNDAWRISTGGDFNHPKTTGKPPSGTKLINRYVKRAMVVGHTDPVVAKQFSDVGNLLVPPTTLMKPRILRRVLFAKT